jgi:hypothetical protein
VVSTHLKNISQLGLLFPIYGKIKNVPNHQPDPEWFLKDPISLLKKAPISVPPVDDSLISLQTPHGAGHAEYSPAGPWWFTTPRKSPVRGVTLSNPSMDILWRG